MTMLGPLQPGHDRMRGTWECRGGKVMRRLLVALVALVPWLAVAPAAQEAKDAGSADKLIAEALLPLPESLRPGATVVLDRQPGKREVLRKGTNEMVCRASAPGSPFFFVRCYHKDLETLMTRLDELTASGTNEHQMHETLGAEVKSGKLRIPSGAAVYALAGSDVQGALPIMVVYMPGATSESTGLSSQPNSYRPWLMFAGTPIAHIMIPGK
jgi:hypothetical protein